MSCMRLRIRIRSCCISILGQHMRFGMWVFNFLALERSRSDGLGDGDVKLTLNTQETAMAILIDPTIATDTSTGKTYFLSRWVSSNGWFQSMWMSISRTPRHLGEIYMSIKRHWHLLAFGTLLMSIRLMWIGLWRWWSMLCSTRRNVGLYKARQTNKKPSAIQWDIWNFASTFRWSADMACDVSWSCS